MSGVYQEVDLDTIGKAKPGEEESEFEIVEEDAEPAPAPAPAAAEAEDDDEEAPAEQAATKRLSRSQRLKLQRDNFAQQLAATQAELTAERGERTKLQNQNEEAATAGYDFYIQTLSESMKGLRSEFDLAFDTGDREKLFNVQQQMAELAAEKKQAEREKAGRPTKAATGSEDQKSQTPPTTGVSRSPQQQLSPAGKPNPLAMEWAKRHDEWFGKNPVMTMAARVLDSQLAQEGFDAGEPEYFDELDKRLKDEFPQRFAGAATAKRTQAQTGPTVSHRAATLSPGQKVKVVITAQDRDLARRLNITVEEYAKQKARREAASNSVSGYTEIV